MRRLLCFVRCQLPVYVAVLALIAGTMLLPESVNAQSGRPRRVNIPYFTGAVDWAQTTIFWFGKNELSLPGRNYTDVRAAYTASGLQVRVVVVDYYLWYIANPTAASDLTQYDAVALYLDTNHDRAAAPQLD